MAPAALLLLEVWTTPGFTLPALKSTEGSQWCMMPSGDCVQNVMQCDAKTVLLGGETIRKIIRLSS